MRLSGVVGSDDAVLLDETDRPEFGHLLRRLGRSDITHREDGGDESCFEPGGSDSDWTLTQSTFASGARHAAGSVTQATVLTCGGL